jgi:hypothetical protein
MRTRVVAAAVTFAALAAATATERERFIDQQHPSACDTNAGTESAPFKSITGMIKG